MKALSISRPWPWAILHLGKRIENRRRKDGRMPSMCRHRGPLLLHAAKSWDGNAVEWMYARDLIDLATAQTIADRSLHPAGGIFARCNAVGHIEPHEGKPMVTMTDEPFVPGRAPVRSHFGDRFVRAYDKASIAAILRLDLRWWMGGYALVLADVQPTPFIECRGMLGLWTPPAAVLEQVGGAP